MEDEENFLMAFPEEDEEEEESPEQERRPVCKGCFRPASACWCSFVPDPLIDVATNIVILQHPAEIHRPLRTAPMVERGLNPSKVHTLRAVHFNPDRQPALSGVTEDPTTVVLYPAQDSVDLATLPRGSVSRLIVLDGTWRQAKRMFQRNPWLDRVKKVVVDVKSSSEYVIRTQPTNRALSTVEAVAHALAVIEDKPSIAQELVRPLRRLCSQQISHGAVVHHSKELLHQHGLLDKPYYPHVWRRLNSEGRLTNLALECSCQDKPCAHASYFGEGDLCSDVSLRQLVTACREEEDS